MSAGGAGSSNGSHYRMSATINAKPCKKNKAKDCWCEYCSEIRKVIANARDATRHDDDPRKGAIKRTKKQKELASEFPIWRSLLTVKISKLAVKASKEKVRYYQKKDRDRRVADEMLALLSQ